MTATHVKRAFKYRFYPTDAQTAELSRTFGYVRKVYNMALEARTAAWQRGERVNYNATSAMLTGCKKSEELAFLCEVSSVPLQQALRHLQGAFTNFFAKRAKYPRFKSRKKSGDSAEYTTSAFRWRDGQLTLAKMAEPLTIVWSRPIPRGARPSTVTVRRDAAGRWFVSILCKDLRIQPLPTVDGAVGIDVGITSLVTASRPIEGLTDPDGKVANPKCEREDRARLAKAQREHARKTKGSKNREKARVKVARVHARIAYRRRDFLHKLTFQAVLALRHYRRQCAAQHPRMGLRLRRTPRPGRERSTQYPGRRAGGCSLWRRYKTSTEHPGRAVVGEAGSSPTAAHTRAAAQPRG
nr:transposase [Kitasatospora acidiphila]